MSSKSKVYAFEEVAKHNLKDDCWLLISGKAYNVTRFLDDHPGGDEILLTATGKDATDEFEDIGHSESAREMMNEYYVGEVDAATIPSKKPKSTKTQPSNANQPSQNSGFLVKFLQFLLPLIILGVAFALKQLNKEE